MASQESLFLDRSSLMSINAKFPRRPLLKIGLIGASVAVITLLHYTIAPEAGIIHVIFRELYFLPIILGGFWFGMRGGLSTSLTISILYGPLVLMGPDRLSPHDFGNAMEILLFNLVGGLLGWLHDREAAQQDRLRQAENLAALGRATAMIAHDLKTPLVTIAGLARRLTGKISPATPEGEKITVIRQQADRLEKLVMDMLFFARPMQLTLADADTIQLLAKAGEAVGETARSHKIHIDLPEEDAGCCRLDHDKMMLVLINLFTNAVEASSPGATVSVTLHNYADAVRIDVTDRGCGIPEDLKTKIFEPFVTGKHKGTGLGLPICRKIIEAHAGKLEWRSNPAGGTTFSISIPRVQ